MELGTMIVLGLGLTLDLVLLTPIPEPWLEFCPLPSVNFQGNLKEWKR